MQACLHVPREGCVGSSSVHKPGFQQLVLSSLADVTCKEENQACVGWVGSMESGQPGQVWGSTSWAWSGVVFTFSQQV